MVTRKEREITSSIKWMGIESTKAYAEGRDENWKKNRPQSTNDNYLKRKALGPGKCGF